MANDSSGKITFPSVPYEGYIFDCDGTLVDSMPLHYRSWCESLKKFGATFEFTPELFMSVAGVGHDDTVQIFNKRFNQQLDSRAARAKEAWYDEHIEELQPLTEVAEYAKSLHRKGAKISVASGGTRYGVNRSLEICDMGGIFPVVVTMDDGTRSKPAPDLFLLAAERMGVDPAKCVVFEDSPLGIEAAQKAGMASVKIPSFLEMQQ